MTGTSFIVSTVFFNSYVQEIHSEKLIELKNDEISTEKKKSDNLLNNILPEEISHELKTTGKVKPRHYSSATVMMIDFKNFSRLSKELTTEQLITDLDYAFKNFDRLIAARGLEKIKTMGDAYMCVGGEDVMLITLIDDPLESAIKIRPLELNASTTY